MSTQPESVAIAALGGGPLTYAGLAGMMDFVGGGLRRAGIGRNDVVGIVTPNGPMAATSFLSVANAATAAPLNPTYREAEFEFYMDDLEMKAIVIPEGGSGAAEKVATTRGITIIRPNPTPEQGAGAFEIDSQESLKEQATLDDVALILHTSGTTSRPKMVPLTHRNLAASAVHIADTLRLTPEDRCLNVMPLFHIHGLVAAVLASLYAGASVVCTPGFAAPEFFGWLELCRPTWYTAVPTIHHAVVERAAREGGIAPASLRFARSSSSSLAPQLMQDLEGALGVPVIEAYGMTEAAHQMASNPLPPGVRKPGSVGPAAGPQVAIMSESGEILPSGEEGEIVISGPNVMDGYAANPAANAEAFEDGWFRTGDLGWIDSDGYVSISGRKKEIINRGGETISPREIDEALLDHPSVMQVLAFAVPDRRLGEQVAAAVVVDPAAGEVSEHDIRRFAQLKLSDAKVPRRIVFLDEIPKGPTGKLQRIGLAERLGISELEGTDTPQPFTPPTSTIEILLADLWKRVLGLDETSVHDRFLDVGGDSLLATRLMGLIREETGIELTMLDLSDRATIAEQADLIEVLLLEGDSTGE
ncbi:MAG: AMP-binding protein [Acidimicrobiia bacterium]